MARSHHPPSIPTSFVTKKARILSLLTQSEDEYTDNSPKGTVDSQIRDLIDEINAHDGLVTTSSCAGRAAVFVEGPRVRSRPEGPERPERVVDEVGRDGVDGQPQGEGRKDEVMGEETTDLTTTTSTTTTTSPGGKGGGRWLYVSHEPVPEIRARSDAAGTGTRMDTRTAVDATQDHQRPSSDHFTQLFNLSRSPDTRLSKSTTESASSSPPPSPSLPRLIHLTFSPLILHIHCATLQHARPLLAAAINAGFRESGVQSLRVMDDPEHGVMVAVRTAGLSFETAVGVVVVPRDEGQGETEAEEVMQSIVDEEYLAMCARVVNQRFAWNGERRERFRAELRRAMQRDGFSAGPTGSHEDEVGAGWEDKDERRRRKREEGLERQRQSQRQQQT